MGFVELFRHIKSSSYQWNPQGFVMKTKCVVSCWICVRTWDCNVL